MIKIGTGKQVQIGTIEGFLAEAEAEAQAYEAKLNAMEILAQSMEKMAVRLQADIKELRGS